MLHMLALCKCRDWNVSLVFLFLSRGEICMAVSSALCCRLKFFSFTLFFENLLNYVVSVKTAFWLLLYMLYENYFQECLGNCFRSFVISDQICNSTCRILWEYNDGYQTFIIFLNRKIRSILHQIFGILSLDYKCYWNFRVNLLGFSC